MRKISLLLLFPLIAILVSCTKTELEEVPSNESPPDNTISKITIENYINRTYILVLGREPDSSEYSFSYNLLSPSLDTAARRSFVTSVLTDPDFRLNVYHQNRLSLLNNVDTSEFTFWINVFQYYLNDTAYQILWPYYQYEVDRMTDMRDAYGEFMTNAINVDELQRRMCNNSIYDEINMGSANFVISTFQNLINRNPTIAEQQAGISMVDGSNAVLFLQAGSSKADYLDIFTHSNDYFEGQVILLYWKYLNRTATSVEMSEGAAKYSSTNDYTAVQKDILTTDEFIGL